MPTPRFKFPYLVQSQAQKEVTHNDALNQLDAFVDLTILDRDLTAPPASPADGDTYLVPGSSTGGWTGHEGKIAYSLDGGWRFFVPVKGQTAYVADEQVMLVYTGSGWVDLVTLMRLQNLPLLGINTTADATNPLAARINKALFTALYAADGGDGSLMYTMNKEASGKDVGLLLQTNYVLHAMVGLFGDDDFYIKVSPDGSSFNDAIRIDKSTGIASLTRLPRFTAAINYDAYLPVATWTKVPINDAAYNDQSVFDGAGNHFTAPVTGTYVVGAALGWHQNGSNVPTNMRARLVKNSTSVVHGPAQGAVVEGVITLEAATLVELAANDTIELQAWFTGTDGYIASGLGQLWGHLVG